MRCDAGHLDFPTAQMQEKQDVVCYEPAQGPHLVKSGPEVVTRDPRTFAGGDPPGTGPAPVGAAARADTLPRT